MQISERRKQETVLPSYAYELQQGLACHKKAKGVVVPHVSWYNQLIFNLT